MLRKNLVIVPHHARALDMALVEQWGDPVILENRSIYADQTERFDDIPKSVIPALKTAGYLPDQDFVLLGGDRAIVALVLAEMAANYSHLRLLKWDAHGNAYYEVWWNRKT